MKVNELFHLHSGNDFELINMTESNRSNINFISRKSGDNGVASHVDLYKEKEPFPAGWITVALSGSVLSSFVQLKPFYTAFHISVLEPINEMTLQEKLYYCMCIKFNNYRYNYGRQANKTLKDIKLPAEIPYWVYKTKIEHIKTNIKKKKHLFDTTIWKEFRLASLFKPIRGKRLTKLNRIQGNIPFITAGYENEGLAEKIGNSEVELYSNKVTIDMFCNSFYRGYNFACDDNIIVLCEKEDIPTINEYTGLFIATIINKEHYKYAFGRQYRQKNFYKHLLKLPVTHSGKPDWHFMENYIKSLPFADKVQM